MIRQILYVLMIVSGFSHLSFAQDFSYNGIELLQNKPVPIQVQKKKGIVVLFLAAKCPSSNSHLDEIKSLSKEFQDFVFVAVHSNQNENPSEVRSYFATQKLPFVIIDDQNGKWLDHFKALKTPHAFLVSPSGKILYRGGISNSHFIETAHRLDLREALDDIQHDHAVRVPEGRALGCIITRKRS